MVGAKRYRCGPPTPDTRPDGRAGSGTLSAVDNALAAGNDALDLTGRSAIVTGGTKGIGRAIAERFLAAGASVVVCARNRPDHLPTAGGRSAVFVACDVRDGEQVRAVVQSCLDATGRVDVLVNNAGGAPPVASAEASDRFDERVLALNLLAPITFARAVHGPMTAQGSGVIINIASVSGMRANPMGVAYGAAKAGLLNATETLAVEWAPAIRVVAITAGLVLTDDARAFYGDDESVAKVAATVPLGRLGEPGDIADACLFAASPLAAYVSGANLVVHGGGERPAYLNATDAL
jgi:NAD(P)-dependent dehydrogenase (short-subunit alcohol dehydrogenase family)